VSNAFLPNEMHVTGILIHQKANSVAWVASNVEGSYKRSVTLGMAIGFGNINGAVTANIVRTPNTHNHQFQLTFFAQYRAKDRPWYRLGHSIVLFYITTGFMCSLLFAVLLKRENACRERGQRDEIIRGAVNDRAHERNGSYDSVEEAKVSKGDKWSGFRYVL